jgi:hypothetical protein
MNGNKPIDIKKKGSSFLFADAISNSEVSGIATHPLVNGFWRNHIQIIIYKI